MDQKRHETFVMGTEVEGAQLTVRGSRLPGPALVLQRVNNDHGIHERRERLPDFY